MISLILRFKDILGETVTCMVPYGIAYFKPIKLPPKIEAGDASRKPLKPLCTIHIVNCCFLLFVNKVNLLKLHNQSYNVHREILSPPLCLLISFVT